MNKSLQLTEVLEILRQQKNILSDRFYVRSIGVFGSFARNESTSQSDIDFLVEFDVPLEKYISNKFALHDYLANLFDRKVDLANPKSIKPFYKQTVLNEAVYA